MSQGNSEILFNKRNIKSPLKQSPSTARGILYIIEGHGRKGPWCNGNELMNLYTRKVQKAGQQIQKKIQQEELRPFEFVVNRN